MRREAKRTQNVQHGRIQGYHAGGHVTNYAFAGFTGNWYFNSDRCIALDATYMRTDGGIMLGYGLEIEVECNGIRSSRGLADVLEKIILPNFKFGAKMFKMQSDASLGGHTSAEIITQVMTKARIRNDYAAYQTMFDDYFDTFGISADPHRTNCGMHVNVSNGIFGKTKDEQEESIRKLHYLLGRWYKLMCVLFNRPVDRTNWCGEMTESHLHRYEYDYDGEMSRMWAWQNARNIDFSAPIPEAHQNCLNASHYHDGRIEIRLVGGQDSYYRFRNTMECIFFLTEAVRRLKWEDLEDLTKVFRKCNQYVVKRLRDCVGMCGFTAEMLAQINATAVTEDLELH